MPPKKSNPTVFISHTTADDALVAELRQKLELHGFSVWVDSLNLRGGDRLAPEIKQAIKAADHFICVLSPKTKASTWVSDEINYAKKVGCPFWKFWQKDNRIIPLMLPGITPRDLSLWFKNEPIGVKIEVEPGRLQEAMPDIVAALGKSLPNDAIPDQNIETKPIAELLLELSRPELKLLENGSQQLSAEATLTFYPCNLKLQPEVSSKSFRFISPIGKIEQDDLKWYLEDYYIWPSGLFDDRAKRIEADLPNWGKALYDGVLAKEAAHTVVSAWKMAWLFFMKVDVFGLFLKYWISRLNWLIPLWMNWQASGWLNPWTIHITDSTRP